MDGKKLKVKLVMGKPIHFDLMIDGEVTSYELVCPICGNKFWVGSLDKEMVGCTDPDCPCVALYRLKTTADMSQARWKI